MQKAYDLVPEGYKFSKEINLEKNMNHFVLVNLFSLLVLLPVLPLLYFVDFKNFDISLLLIGFLAFFVIIMIHEWIHGIFFYHYSKKKVKYKFHGWAFSASTPNTFYVKHAYFVIGLAPAVIINGILLILFFIFKDLRLMFFFILALHFSGCAGDFYVTLLISKYPKDTIVEDTGVGMLIFENKGIEPLDNNF